MAKFVFKDAALLVNGVDLSDYVREAACTVTRERVEATGMQASGKEYLPGDRDDSFEFTLMQDFEAAKVNATLWPLFVAGTEFEVKLSHQPSPHSASNPAFVGDCTLIEYTPITGKRADLAEIKVTMPCNGAITTDET